MSERPPESSPSPSRRGGGRHRFRLGRLESADEYRPLHNVKEQLWNRFAPQKSTEELHRETHPDKFVHTNTGAFGQIRQQMDYSYHAHYRKDRLWLHDSIVEDVMMMADTSSFSNSSTISGGNGSLTTTSLTTVAEGPPWLILVVGTRESQKHAVVADLIDAHRLRLSPRFVTVDAGMANG
jgi:hypothetical protein